MFEFCRTFAPKMTVIHTKTEDSEMWWTTSGFLRTAQSCHQCQNLWIACIILSLQLEFQSAFCILAMVIGHWQWKTLGIATFFSRNWGELSTQAHAKGVVLCEKACCCPLSFELSFYLHASFETMLLQKLRFVYIHLWPAACYWSHFPSSYLTWGSRCEICARGNHFILTLPSIPLIPAFQAIHHTWWYCTYV